MKNGLVEGCIVDGDCIACVFDDPGYTQDDCDYAKKITCKEECIYWKPDADEDFALAHIRAEARADALREAAGIAKAHISHHPALYARSFAIASAIERLIDQMQEDVCEVRGHVNSDLVSTACRRLAGRGFIASQLGGNCPYCGKPIKVKE